MTCGTLAPGVVDQNVDLAHGCHGRVSQALDIVAAGHVGDDIFHPAGSLVADLGSGSL
jgi:hypothetical protein